MMEVWLLSGGDFSNHFVANISSERRKIIAQRCSREGVSRIIFIESICNDPAVVEANIRETKVTSPEYVTINVLIVIYVV